MAKYVRIHLQISCDFFCHMRHSIETNLWTCNWPVNKIQVYKVVSIDRVSPNARSNGKCQNKKFLHFQMDIFCHFDFCHNRRNGFGSSTNHKPIKSLQTESVENLLKIGSQLSFVSYTKVLHTQLPIQKDKRTCLLSQFCIDRSSQPFSTTKNCQRSTKSLTFITV